MFDYLICCETRIVIFVTALFLCWCGPTHRAIGLPQIQEADMASFRTAYAFIERLLAYRAGLHELV